MHIYLFLGFKPLALFLSVFSSLSFPLCLPYVFIWLGLPLKTHLVSLLIQRKTHQSNPSLSLSPPLCLLNSVCLSVCLSISVVYFDQLTGNVHTQKLVKTLFWAVFNFFGSFKTIFSDFTFKKKKIFWKWLKKRVLTSFRVHAAPESYLKYTTYASLTMSVHHNPLSLYLSTI